MSTNRETAPIRIVAFGLLTLVFSWAFLTLHRSGEIDWSLRVNKVPSVFRLSRAVDGWQFDLLVAICGLLALASIFLVGLAISDLIAPGKAEA
jgi:hypothetical protein